MVSFERKRIELNRIYISGGGLEKTASLEGLAGPLCTFVMRNLLRKYGIPSFYPMPSYSSFR